MCFPIKNMKKRLRALGAFAAHFLRPFGIAACNLNMRLRRPRLTLAYNARIRDCVLHEPVCIGPGADLRGVQLGAFSYVAGRTLIGVAKIGRFCSIGPNCLIAPGRHPSRDFFSTSPWFYSACVVGNEGWLLRRTFEEFEGVTIEDDVWIGANVVIQDGITVGRGAVIGAGAIVTHDVPAWTIAAGVPAREIGRRFSTPEMERAVEASRWWERSEEELRTLAQAVTPASWQQHIDPKHPYV